MSASGWIGVDLDGTLAYYAGWKGVHHIGDPIVPMLNRVLEWRRNGVEVRIFTARVAIDPDGMAKKAIEDWCQRHIGEVLPITNVKDFKMVELWDDRAVQVVPNRGVRIDGKPD